MIEKERIQRAEDSLVAYRNRVDNFLVSYLSVKISALKEIEPLGEEAGK